MRERFRNTLLIVAAMLLAPTALAGTFRIAAGGDGRELVLDMPDGWRAHTSSPEGAPVRTVAFSPPQGESFKVLVSVLPLPADPSRPPLSQQDLRESVQASADQAETQSVESALVPIDLIGPDVGGAYFQATDRAPPPGEFKHLTQGVLRVGTSVLTFTVLANDDAPGGPATIRAQALAALRGATVE